MGILERFEDSLDRMVSGAFARAFKAEVQPVEIASAVQREMDDRAAVIDRERTVVPNIFYIELSNSDFLFSKTETTCRNFWSSVFTL